MKKNSLLKSGILFCFILMFGVLVNPAITNAGPRILKFAVGIPPGDPLVEGLKPWIANFNKEAKGKYEIKMYPGGVLAGLAEMLDSVRTGAIEIGHGSIPTFAGQHKAFSAVEVPYLLDSYEANIEYVVAIADYQNEILESVFNQKLLCTWSGGFNELYTTKKQVKTIEDINGLNMIVTAPLMAKSAGLVGASPVTLDWPDEYPSLQKGLADGGMATTIGALAFMKYYEVINYFTVSNKSATQYSVTINLDVYDRLPADLQKVMSLEAEKYARAMDLAMKAFNTWAIGVLSENGVKFYKLPAAERARWKKACSPIADAYWKKMGKDAEFLRKAAQTANEKFPYTTDY